MWFITLVIKNILQRKVRSALTCTGIGLAICAVVTMVGMADGFWGAISGTYEDRGADIMVSRARSPQQLVGQLDEKLGSRLRTLPGVHNVDAMLLDVVSFEQSGIAAVYVWAFLPDSTLAERTQVVVGRKMQATDQHPLLLGRTLAESLGKKIGDKLEMEGGEFEVVGIFEGRNMFENSTAAVNLRDLQRLLGMSQRVTFFLIKLDNPRDDKSKNDVCQAIKNLVDEGGNALNLSALPTEQHWDARVEAKVMRGMAWATSFVALLIGFIGVLNTMLISVAERTPEIGTMRAVGWSKSRIVRMILSETLVLYSVGVPVGLLLSVGLTTILTRLEATSMFVPAVIEQSIMAKGCLLALVASVMGSLYPAVRAARLLPTEAIRQ